ncbi:MAG TPA: hemolysin III family protein [Prolixibacteraceae bacterium]|nr:hemolysin III family protein [Prolixibacteraceae bacterium]
MEKEYSSEEERWNILTHGFGLLISVIGSIILLVKAYHLHSLKIFIAFLVYGIGVTTMFLASTLYHSAKAPGKRKMLNIFDHIAIYLTIAGSYTPITLLTMPPDWGIPVLIAVWLIALTGIILKFFFTGRFSKLSTAMYVLMGWVIVVALKPLINSMETAGLVWLLAGGLTYTAGALIYQISSINFNHAIFHVCVLLGAAFHYIVVFGYCIK